MFVPNFKILSQVVSEKSLTEKKVKKHTQTYKQKRQKLVYTLSLAKQRTSILTELELMSMKHYAPNRCLYIKVAKLRTGVGSAEISHLQNCSLKIYLKRALGVVGLGGSGWL